MPPMRRALRPSTPGDFPVAEKVTKGAPRAAPFGIPRYEVSALFALAALRFGSRRATFYLRPRPICHFEIAEGIGLIFSLRLAEVTPPVFKPWRGRWTNWRLAGVVITICSHRYDTFTVTNDQTLSPYLYYYHYLFYIKRVSFVTVSQQMAYLCGLLLILGVIPA